MGDVIQGTFPQHNARRREEEALAHLASDIWTQLHAPEGPQLGGLIDALKYFDSAPSEMPPPEAS